MLNRNHQPKKQQRNNPTSWGGVATWYDEYLQDENTYQAKVIAPNLMRILAVEGMSEKTNVLELGCGQGYFLKTIRDSTKKGKPHMEGVDVSAELLGIAQKELGDTVIFTHTEASKLAHIQDKSIHSVFSVLALQNMSDLDAVIKEVKRVLDPKGQFVAVINHPAFRVPKQSDWYFSSDRNAQGRVVYTYMSDKKFAIDMHPGKTASGEKVKETYSFHHPLQYYAKTFAKHGLCIARIEEWISHKVSEEGPKKRIEDDARKEIPMFMCFEIKNIA